MKKILLLFVCLFFVNGFALGQNFVGEQSNAPCMVLAAGKSGANNLETAFCNVCNYWTNGIVPYTFDAAVSSIDRTRMENAMARIEGIGNLNFVVRNGESNYIYIKNSDKTYNYSSHIGMNGGRQEIGITSWTSPMIICHELMHALGFYHEQSRPDRDNYIQVNTANICSNGIGQFDIENTGATPNIPYDFRSIMHYGTVDFSRCLLPNEDCTQTNCTGGIVGPTLQIKPAYQNGQNFIGNRNRFSAIDSIMLRFTYPTEKDRFINNASVGAGPYYGKTLYNALKTFIAHPLVLDAIPVGSDVWFMPGVFENAEGIYTKAMTLHAPFGGVVLR